MLILVKHICRNILEKKFQSIAIIFIVALSTLVTIITLSMQTVVNDTYDKVYNASVGEANITIEYSDFIELSNLNLAGVNIEKQQYMYDSYGKFYKGESVIRANIRGIDLAQYRNMDSIALIQSPEDFTLELGQCIISTKTAEKYGFAVGDTVELSVRSKPYYFRVAALGENNRTFYEEQGNIQVLVTLEDANMINQTNNVVTKVRLKTQTELSEAIEILKKDNQGYTIYGGEEYDNLHFQLQSVSSAMLIIMSIVILIGGYIIYSLVKIIMVSRLPVVSTFRSIGIDKDKIVLILLAEFLAYGIIGILIGVLLGIVGLPMIADLFNQYKEYGVETVVVYQAKYILLASIIGLLLPPVMAMSNIMRISSKNLKDMILQTHEQKKIRSNRSAIKTLVCFLLCFLLYILNNNDNFMIGLITNLLLIVGSAFFVQMLLPIISRLMEYIIPISGSGKLGIKSIRQNIYIRNTSSMIVVIFMIFMLVMTIVDGISNTAQMDLESYGFDIIAKLNNEKNVSAEQVSNFNGVSGAFESYEIMAYGKYANGYCRVYGIDNFDKLNQYMEALQYSGTNLDGKLASQYNGIVIDKYWAKVQKISIGDQITLFHDKERKSKPIQFTVVDTWDSSKGTTDRVFVGISLDTYKRVFSDVPERILIKTNNDSEQIATTIANNYIDTDISVSTTGKFLEEQVNMVNTIINILVSSIMMSALVIVIGITSNLIVSFINRKKEYAALYSICMDMRQLRNMTIWEMMASYITIIITLLILSIPVVKCTPKLTNGLGLIINYNLNPGILLGIFGITFIITMLTTIGPIRELNKLNIVKELKYE